MPTTCLICCEEAEYFLLPPCNHKQMCWKCSSTLIEGSTFSCPYCKGTPDGASCILFVHESEMQKYNFLEVLALNPFRSTTKSYQLYSNKNVAVFIQQSTSIFCKICNEIFMNMNSLKKHLNQIHRRQFCDVCLQNKKCLLSEQYLYTEGQLISHYKRGEYSGEGELILYHPNCDFCRMKFYDVDAFRMHLRTSTHLKCHICEQNYPKLKYIYYKDYPQIQLHFKKSHFMCQTGNCIAKQLQNVFITQDLLQEHRIRVHEKGFNKNQKPVMNILLFGAGNEAQPDWDKIGKDFRQEFQALQKNVELKNQTHHDEIIDIRQFYPDKVKNNSKLSIQQIKNRLFEHLYNNSQQTSQGVNFNTVLIFYPLQMVSLSRVQLQKLIRQIFQPKYSEPLIETFFTRKFEFRAQNDYFLDIKRKMWSYSPYCYYYLFPQLIRYFKDSNVTKLQMDKFYAESLRNLKVNRLLIFHNKQRYSQIFNIIQFQIQQYIRQQIIDQKIDLKVYKTYMKDLSSSFYQENHKKMFYVQRQKIKNMYHMIQKTKTTEILKLNWLLKLGLPNESYRKIYENFYYKTIEECTKFTHLLSIQDLALLYSYSDICLQALMDQRLFESQKKNPPTYFLTTIVQKLDKCMTNKQFQEIKNLELKSTQIFAKINNFVVEKKKKKNQIINQQDHPSLLSNNTRQNDQRKSQPESYFGVPFQNYNSKVKINKIKQKETKNVLTEQQQFPGLIKIKQIPKQQIVEEEEFPSLNSNDKKTNKKVKDFDDDKNVNIIKKYDLFNPSSSFPSKKWADDFYQQKDFKKQQPPPVKKYEQKQLEVKSKKKNKTFVEKQVSPVVEQIVKQKQVNEIIFKKKTKQQLKQQEQTKNKKSKYQKKSKGEAKQKKQQKQQSIQQQVTKNLVRFARLDCNFEEQQKIIQEQLRIQKQLQRQQKLKKLQQQKKLQQDLKHNKGFDSLLEKQSDNKQKNSLINTLIQSSRTNDTTQNQIKIKRGKKGKAVVIEKFDFRKL